VKAVLVHPSPDGGRLELAEIPEPHAGPGEVVVAVHAASVNRADLLMRRGTYAVAATGAPVAGLDCAGEVVEVGEGVSGLELGARVMTMARGSYTERVAVDARRPVPLPPSWSFADGAASIVGLMTEHDALVTTAGLRRGDAVVINAAASGVGLYGVQLASLLGAGVVIALIRRARPQAQTLLEALGASRVIAAGGEGRFAEAVLGATGERGADIIIDHVGGSWLAETMRCVAPYGRVVGIGRLGGSSGELDLDALALRRARIIGSTFRIRSDEEIAAVVAALRADADDALAQGRLRALVDCTFPLEEAEAAHQRVAADEHLGKVVLEVGV
jgi:NADPH:quinone reductase